MNHSTLTFLGSSILITLVLPITAHAQTCTEAPCLPNLISNGSFSSGTSSWSLSVSGGGSASWSVVSGKAEVDIASITSSDPKISHQHLKQAGLTIANSKTYRVTFDVKANSARTVRADVMKNSSPYTNYGQQTFNLTPTFTEYSFEFTMGESTDTNARFRFVFGDDTPDLTFDNVNIEEL